MRFTFAVAGTAVVALIGNASAQDTCNQERAKAWGDFVRCVEYVAGSFYLNQAANPSPPGLAGEFLTCRKQYFDKWSSLDLPSKCRQRHRFESTDGGATVTDHLTTLVWEKKTEVDGPQAPTEVFSWSASSAHKEDGTAFSDFLPALNASPFATVTGSKGWRLPTMPELQTIMHDNGNGLEPGFVSAAGDDMMPSGQPTSYWTSTSYPVSPPGCICGAAACECYTLAWNVHFNNSPIGSVNVDGKTGARHCRGVRGGL